MPNKLHMYADRELGAYGYAEKAWFLPHVRLNAFLERLDREGLNKKVKFNKAGPASPDDLLLLHTPEYIDFVKKRCAEGTGALDHGATFARPHMERAASHVVGAVMDATRRIIARDAATEMACIGLSLTNPAYILPTSMKTQVRFSPILQRRQAKAILGADVTKTVLVRPGGPN